METSYKVIEVDTLKLRAWLLDQVYDKSENALNLPEYNGMETNKYMKRKIVRTFLANKIREIINRPYKMEIVDHGKFVKIFVPNAANVKSELLELQQNLLAKNLPSYQMNLGVFESDLKKAL